MPIGPRAVAACVGASAHTTGSLAQRDLGELAWAGGREDEPDVGRAVDRASPGSVRSARRARRCGTRRLRAHRGRSARRDGRTSCARRHGAGVRRSLLRTASSASPARSTHRRAYGRRRSPALVQFHPTRVAVEDAAGRRRAPGARCARSPSAGSCATIDAARLKLPCSAAARKTWRSTSSSAIGKCYGIDQEITHFSDIRDRPENGSHDDRPNCPNPKPKSARSGTRPHPPTTPLAGHGLFAEAEREAWCRLLQRHLGDEPRRVLDVGTGTGFLALRCAEIGHDVTAIDVSEAMLAVGRATAARAGLAVNFVLGSSELEAVAGQTFDAIVCRHLVWTLPQPERTLRPLACGAARRGSDRRDRRNLVPARGIDRSTAARRAATLRQLTGGAEHHGGGLSTARAVRNASRSPSCDHPSRCTTASNAPDSSTCVPSTSTASTRSNARSSRSPTASRSAGAGSWSEGSA